MNILYVLHKDPGASLGGVERHTNDLARILSLNKLNIYMLFPCSSGMVVTSFTKGKTVNRRTGRIFCDDLAIEHRKTEDNFVLLLEKYSIDTVHFQHLLGYPLSLIRVAKMRGARVFVTVHDYFFWCPSYKLLSPLGEEGLQFCFFQKESETCAKCLQLFYKRPINARQIQIRRTYVEEILSGISGIFFPSKYIKDVFCSLFSIENARIHVIEHGIDRPSCHTKHISREAINIAYLGAFTLEKGARYFLELVKKFSDIRGPDKVNFHIIGELGYPFPGDIRDCLNLSIKGSYRLDQLHRMLSDNNIDLVMFFPIWPETYSYTLSESVIHGIPVIASDIGALRERVSGKSLGYLVPYENPVPFAEEIVGEFLKYPELHEYFRHHCLAYGKEMPDVHGMAKQYMEIYTSSVSLSASI